MIKTVEMDRSWQPRPRTRSADLRAGFTLIEVVAVMLIIALVASLAVSMMTGTGRGGLKALTLETAALLRRERLGAIMTGRAREVSIDGGRRVLVGDGGDVLAIPRDVASTFSASTHCGLAPGRRSFHSGRSFDRGGTEIIT